VSDIPGKADRAGTVRPGEEKGQWVLRNVYKYLMGVNKEDRARFFFSTMW